MGSHVLSQQFLVVIRNDLHLYHYLLLLSIYMMMSYKRKATNGEKRVDSYALLINLSKLKESWFWPRIGWLMIIESCYENIIKIMIFSIYLYPFQERKNFLLVISYDFKERNQLKDNYIYYKNKKCWIILDEIKENK